MHIAISVKRASAFVHCRSARDLTLYHHSVQLAHTGGQEIFCCTLVRTDGIPHPKTR